MRNAGFHQRAPDRLGDCGAEARLLSRRQHLGDDVFHPGGIAHCAPVRLQNRCPLDIKLTPRQQVAQEDHSPVWVERSNQQWVDEGLNDVCKLAPAALINLWKVGVTCK